MFSILSYFKSKKRLEAKVKELEEESTKQIQKSIEREREFAFKEGRYLEAIQDCGNDKAELMEEINKLEALLATKATVDGLIEISNYFREKYERKDN